MPSHWNALKQWFRTEGMFVRKGDPRAVTHLLLDGGRIHVPPEREADFLARYAEAVERGTRVYVVETKTPIYKFMMDLDFMAPEPTAPDEIERVLKVVHETVSMFFPGMDDAQRRMVVCRTENKNITKQASPTEPARALIKTGLHLIWPEVYVDSDVALLLRGAVIFRLSAARGTRPSYNPWSEVVDRCVYVGNGLRMVGSRKMSICAACRNNPKKRARCTGCQGDGKQDEGRVYLPTVVLAGADASPDEDAFRQLDNPLTLVQQLSIRTARRTRSVVEVPDWVPEQGPDQRSTAQKRRRRAAKSRRQQEPYSPLPTNPNILPALPETDRRYKLVASFVAQTFPHKPYVTHLHPTRGGDYYLARSNSRFCMNKGGEHANNNIYFYIDRRGVRQKCFCKCPVNRTYGPCARYSSSSYAFSTLVLNTLWPQFRDTGHTLADWERQRASTNMEEWLEEMIKRDVDDYTHKKKHESKFTTAQTAAKRNRPGAPEEEDQSH